MEKQELHLAPTMMHLKHPTSVTTKQVTSAAILDPVLDARLMDLLFNSDAEDEDLNGF